MKNLLKVASAVALSLTLMTAQAQQGDGKMIKKEVKADGKMVKHEGKMMKEDKLMKKEGKAVKKEGKMIKDEKPKM